MNISIQKCNNGWVLVIEKLDEGRLSNFCYVFTEVDDLINFLSETLQN